MIHFAPLRTRRLAVRLKEISIGDAIKIAAIAAEKHEQETTEFLRFVLEEAATPTALHLADPRAWTVQERMFAVCHYLATVSEEGGNFSVGEGAYADYLLPNTDYPRIDVIDCGHVGDAAWQMRPMNGAQAEAIEGLQFERPDAGYFHWVSGAMAAQLCKVGEDVPDALVNFFDYRNWLRDRINAFTALPESEFAELMRCWLDGQQKLAHFFQINFNGNGALAMPVGESAGSLPAARFRAGPCCSEIAARLGGKQTRVGV